MNGSPTAKELGLAHLLIADSAGVESDIVKVSSLKLLAKQLNGPLLNKEQKYRTAFTIYWIANQCPFRSLNKISAVILGVSLSDHTSDRQITNLLDMADGRHSVDQIMALIS